MTERVVINDAIEFVKKKLIGVESGHDWSHAYRVWNMSKKIASQYEVNMSVVELGALLHDVGDSKFHNGNENVGVVVVKEFLEDNGIRGKEMEDVLEIVREISFKSGKRDLKERSIEFKIVQDSDRLDALGAIGIARAFNFGGYKGNELYNTRIKPNMSLTEAENKKKNCPTINHFYEKLLLLEGRMNTIEAKRIAKEKTNFMIEYEKRFREECGIVD